MERRGKDSGNENVALDMVVMASSGNGMRTSVYREVGVAKNV